MQDNSDNRVGYTVAQTKMMEAAFNTLAVSHPDWSEQKIRDQIQAAWVSDDTLNTVEGLIFRVNRDEVLAKDPRF